MLLFYIDEYGDAGMDGDPNDPDGPWSLKKGASDLFILAAVGIADTQRIDLARALIGLKEKWLTGKGTWGDTELKGRHLQRTGERLRAGQAVVDPKGYRKLTSADFGLLRVELGRLWHRFNPMVYAMVIDKRELVAKDVRFSPIGLAYTLLQQRLAQLLDRVYGTTEGCLLIADQQTAHEEFFRSGEMLRTRQALTRRMRAAQRPKFDLLLDKPMWIDPNLNVLDREIIQLPDIVAYSTAQLVQKGEPPTEAWCQWNKMSRQFVREWSTGFIEDAGITIYPKPAAYPPGLR